MRASRHMLVPAGTLEKLRGSAEDPTTVEEKKTHRMAVRTALLVSEAVLTGHLQRPPSPPAQPASPAKRKTPSQ